MTQLQVSESCVPCQAAFSSPHVKKDRFPIRLSSRLTPPLPLLSTELLDVGKPMLALEALHDLLTSKRHK